MDENGTPTPVSALDEQFAVPKDFHRVRWYSVSAVIIAVVGVVVFLLVSRFQDQDTIRSQQQTITQQQQTITQQQREISSSCNFYRVLALYPVTNTPGTDKPSQLAVDLIATSRDTFLGERCGTLPAPSPALVHWSSVYKVKLAG